MRKSMVVVLTLAIVSLWSAKGFTGQDQLNGLLIGAGSGAIIGHAIGGDTESTLFGSAIGGALGVAVTQHHEPYNYRHAGNYNRYDRPYCRIVKKSYYRNGYPYTVTKRICRTYGDYSYGRDYRFNKYDRYYKYGRHYDRDRYYKYGRHYKHKKYYKSDRHYRGDRHYKYGRHYRGDRHYKSGKQYKHGGRYYKHGKSHRHGGRSYRN